MVTEENAKQQEAIRRLRKEKQEAEDALEAAEQKLRQAIKDRYTAEDLKEEAERMLAQAQRKLKSFEESQQAAEQKHHQEVQLKEQKIIKLSRQLNERSQSPFNSSQTLGMASPFAKFAVHESQKTCMTAASVDHDTELKQLRIS